MRQFNPDSVFYAPGEPPNDPSQMGRFLRDEFRKISAAVSALTTGHLDMVYVAPAKPRLGDLRLADGTRWNPGSGAGVYWYNGAAWHFLG